ncbi:MAG: hypothetical protein KC535_05575 [Nanoarchaeota archaeon]|nr:hypothetical protein [Nanoarchaeota archaeon]
MTDKKEEDMGDLLKKRFEARKSYHKNSSMVDLKALVDLYDNTLKGDMKNMDAIDPKKLHNDLLASYERHGGELLKKEHGFDIKTLANLSPHQKKDIYSTLFNVNLDELHRYMVQQGSDIDIHSIVQANAQGKSRDLAQLVGHEISTMNESDREKLMDTYLKQGLKSGEELNYSLAHANPYEAGQAIASILDGGNAQNAVRPYARKKKK